MLEDKLNGLIKKIARGVVYLTVISSLGGVYGCNSGLTGEKRKDICADCCTELNCEGQGYDKCVTDGIVDIAGHPVEKCHCYKEQTYASSGGSGSSFDHDHIGWGGDRPPRDKLSKGSRCEPRGPH